MTTTQKIKSLLDFGIKKQDIYIIIGISRTTFWRMENKVKGATFENLSKIQKKEIDRIFKKI